MPARNGDPPPGSRRLATWMRTELGCIAGRREYAKGRYTIADLAEEGIAMAWARFAEEVRSFRKVALLCLIPRTAANMNMSTPSIDVLQELSGFAAELSALPAHALLDSGVLELPVLVDCPVTGAPTTYSFFGVAFCPQAANVADHLFDLPLSAPLACINITSDAFAFAMFVRDTALSRHGKAPHMMAAKAERDLLFADCVERWQAFSIHTLQGFAARTEGTRCAIRISADGLSWQAAHNDPVFAETSKEPHVHDMPRVYAATLVQHWAEVLDRQRAHFHARSGQSGGTRLAAAPRGSRCPLTALAPGPDGPATAC